MKKILYFIAFSLVMSACSPRIELDAGQWEQNILLSEFVIYTQQIDDITFPDGTVEEGAIKVDLAVATSFDDATSTVSITIPSTVTDTQLSTASCYLTHNGMNVVPLDDSPTPGTVADWSNVTECSYRIEAANDDYTEVWTIKITRE